MIGVGVERVFAPSDLGQMMPGREPALLSTGSWPGNPSQAAGRAAGGAVMWSTPVGDDGAESAAIRLGGRAGVHTVSLVAATTDTARGALVSAFAEHLAEVRAGRLLHGVWITAASRPDPQPGWVRLPHLLTITADGGLDDTVVWELMPAAVVPRWLGGLLPDQSFIESRLDALLALRRAARDGRLPATVAGRHLAGLLRDRYLSLRLVYQHPQLFSALLPIGEGSQ